ncbi:hypothetical protein DUNSADRAFT_2243 [Dunaliella salina]|uniref:Secreted protein n=1 Tax=Dunaliella salina TaxID=3046 RepID=A0ABQ7GW28_DUNSA|nr:hypothetical protein DUNSADRAFT_2243 [Dunaliella salina]|eukprot:KAF5838780.1 hypothetical protein DUNSADRAFT_2243 [Dunaliella salina]
MSMKCALHSCPARAAFLLAMSMIAFPSCTYCPHAVSLNAMSMFCFALLLFTPSSRAASLRAVSMTALLSCLSLTVHVLHPPRPRARQVADLLKDPRAVAADKLISHFLATGSWMRWSHRFLAQVGQQDEVVPVERLDPNTCSLRTCLTLMRC